MISNWGHHNRLLPATLLLLGMRDIRKSTGIDHDHVTFRAMLQHELFSAQIFSSAITVGDQSVRRCWMGLKTTHLWLQLCSVHAQEGERDDASSLLHASACCMCCILRSDTCVHHTAEHLYPTLHTVLVGGYWCHNFQATSDPCDP